MSILYGDNIRAERARKNMSQLQLAEKSGLHYNTITRYEKNRVDIPIGNLMKIARALEVELDDLLKIK